VLTLTGGWWLIKALSPDATRGLPPSLMDLLVVVAESSPELVVLVGSAPVVPKDAEKGHCFVGIAGITPGISTVQ